MGEAQAREGHRFAVDGCVRRVEQDLAALRGS
jgi:hypothetical protein